MGESLWDVREGQTLYLNGVPQHVERVDSFCEQWDGETAWWFELELRSDSDELSYLSWDEDESDFFLYGPPSNPSDFRLTLDVLRQFDDDEAGRFILTPHPNPARMRMTLFPKETASRTGQAPVRKKPEKKGKESSWKVITTWRGFSPELKERISDLASYVELDVPVGELVSAFLHFSLAAYDQGYLKLEPVGEVRGNTLYKNGNL